MKGRAVSLKALPRVSFHYGQLPLINNFFSHFSLFTRAIDDIYIQSNTRTLVDCKVNEDIN